MFSTTGSHVVRPRVTLDEISGLQITIPAARSRVMVLFLGLWLILWFVGELAALSSLAAMAFGNALGLKFANADGSNLPFFMVWLAFWTVAGTIMMDGLVWQFRGHETIGIDLDGRSLTVRRLGTLIPRRTRTFSMDEVRNLRFAPLAMGTFGSRSSFGESWEAQLQWIGTGGGSIAFDHAGGTQRFGTQLPETESRRLIKTIKDRYKIQEDWDEPLPVEPL
jgi:hypothetical protein